MANIKILTPTEAGRQLIKILMNEYGFHISNRSKTRESTYLMKLNHRGRKLRISTHQTKGNLHADVVGNVVFDSPTIINEVEYQAKQLVRQYSKYKAVK